MKPKRYKASWNQMGFVGHDTIQEIDQIWLPEKRGVNNFVIDQTSSLTTDGKNLVTTEFPFGYETSRCHILVFTLQLPKEMR